MLELRNLVDVAGLIVASALSRHESRGLHYSLDWPATLEKAVPTVMAPRGLPGTPAHRPQQDRGPARVS